MSNNLNKFKMRESELTETLDPDGEVIKPASPGQIRFVYVLLKQYMGYSKEDILYYEMDTDFHNMTDFQIKELIADLKEQSGFKEDTNDKWNKKSNKDSQSSLF